MKSRTPREVCEHALEDGFFIAAGDFYASTLAEKLAETLGIHDSGGFVRAGLVPSNSAEEVEGFVEALKRFTKRE